MNFYDLCYAHDLMENRLLSSWSLQEVNTCSSNKARKLLDYKTTTTLEESVEKTKEWIIKNKPREFKYHLPIEIVNKSTPKTWTEKKI